ncbi:hypothetical protein ACLK1T_13400 [Escherichia coli]
MPIRTEQLYQRLKARGVLMVPGHNFFQGWINRRRIRWCISHELRAGARKLERGEIPAKGSKSLG